MVRKILPQKHPLRLRISRQSQPQLQLLPALRPGRHHKKKALPLVQQHRRQRRLRARRRRVGIHLPKSCVSNLGRSGGPAPKSRVQRRVPTRLNARKTDGKKSNGGSKVSGNGMSGITPRPRAVVPLLPQPILGQDGTGARIGKLMIGALGHGGSNQLRRQLSHPRLQATVKQAPGPARGPGLDLHPGLGEEMSLGPRVQVFLLVRTPPG